MAKIIYDVAVSLDGYIAGKNNSIEAFVADGDHVLDYTDRLKKYDTVIMGKNTYEFGYQYGLRPGARAYPHMEHFIFSKSINLNSSDEVTVVRSSYLEKIQEIKQKSKKAIYLCGGGVFAGFLLNNKLIDEIVLKVNPIILGDGIKIFENVESLPKLSEYHSKQYSNGVLLRCFNVV